MPKIDEQRMEKALSLYRDDKELTVPQITAMCSINERALYRWAKKKGIVGALRNGSWRNKAVPGGYIRKKAKAS